MLAILSKFIDADKLGGWVRAGVAALLGLVISKWSVLGSVLTPDLQNALGVLVAGIVVGIWSTLVKSDTAKVQMAAEVPAVKSIQVTDPAIAAATPPAVTLAK
jgi:hypothetical protein